eukprot:1160565-Pelagomonas_calceolata.AAC.5
MVLRSSHAQKESGAAHDMMSCLCGVCCQCTHRAVWKTHSCGSEEQPRGSYCSTLLTVQSG